MTDIAEIIARAIFEAEGRVKDVRWEDADKVLALMPTDWGVKPPSVTDHFRMVAGSAITALQQRGFAVVPVYPTDAMIDAGRLAYSEWQKSDKSLLDPLWSAMLAASPGSSGEKE